MSTPQPPNDWTMGRAYSTDGPSQAGARRYAEGDTGLVVYTAERELHFSPAGGTGAAAEWRLESVEPTPFAPAPKRYRRPRSLRFPLDIFIPGGEAQLHGWL